MRRRYLGRKKCVPARARQPGLDFFDMTEVRPGINAHGFKQAEKHIEDASRCFAIIGSERTICVELDEQDAASRDAVVFRLQMLLRSCYQAQQPHQQNFQQQAVSVAPGILHQVRQYENHAQVHVQDRAKMQR